MAVAAGVHRAWLALLRADGRCTLTRVRPPLQRVPAVLAYTGLWAGGLAVPN
jgi:hypothetical protein